MATLTLESGADLETELLAVAEYCSAVRAVQLGRVPIDQARHSPA